MSLPYKSQKKRRKDLAKFHINTWEEYEEAVKKVDKERLLREQARNSTPRTVKIIGGKAKGAVLEVPPKTRPFTSRMRTTLFDILRDVVEGKTVLDLYSGSGSLGLEALSRGAKSVEFVDAAKQAERVLNENILKTKFLVETEVIRQKAEDYLPEAVDTGKMFEIVFVSPPYKLFNTRDVRKMEHVLNMASQLLPGHVDPDTDLYKGLMVVQYPSKYPLERLHLENIGLYQELSFGRNKFGIFLLQEALKEEDE